MAIIRKHIRACGVDEDMVRGRAGWRGKLQVADPTCVG